MRVQLAERFLLALCAALLVGACQADSGTEQERLFIIGQDLDSVRDYYASECCARPDAVTGYLGFYNLTSEEAGFGGLGIDLQGQPTDQEFDGGAGGVNAWRSATEFEGDLAIGLNMTENDHPGALDRLVSGEYDENIRQFARFLNAIDETVYLRVGYEFEGGWNHGYEDSARYVKAFRRVVDGLREQGVDNVETVWQAASFPLDTMTDGFHNHYPDWYPGDDYVDWMGVSSFLTLDEGPVVEVSDPPPTARALIEEMLDFARQHGKPVMIAEASPQGFDLAKGTNANIAATWDGAQGKDVKIVSPDDIWEQWYGPLFALMNEHADVIRALAYINAHWDAQSMWGPPYHSGYWGNSRLQDSPELAERFNQAINEWRQLP